jgi:hypothetical protein
VSLVKKITGIAGPLDGNFVALVTASFAAVQISGGSDWGSGIKARVFVTQNSVTTFGDSTRLGAAHNSYTITYTFALSAGYTIEAGLDCLLSGPESVDFTDIKVQCVIAKR